MRETVRKFWGAPSTSWEWLALVLILALSPLTPAVRAQTSTDPSNAVGISTNSYTPGLVLWDQCGYEGAPPCGLSNPIWIAQHQTEEYFTFFTTSAGCDLSLNLVNGICTDTGRRTTQASAPNVNAPPWLLAQQSDQLNRISADLPLNMVPLFGTHNSYSTQDGSGNLLSIDQVLTITDQLNLGARYIRLDPISNYTSTSLMVCHMAPFYNFGESSNSFATYLISFLNTFAPTLNSDYQDSPHLCGADPLGRGVISFERPFYLALEEIQHWLQQHPGEVVVIDIENNFTVTNKQTGAIPGYISQLDLEYTLQHVFADTLLTQSCYLNDFANGATMPSLRQVRASGKQALVLFTDFEYNPSPILPAANSYIYGDGIVWSLNSLSQEHTSSTNDSNFSSCYDDQGYLVINRDSIHREDIGEDRSVSNALNTNSLQIGLISWTDAAIATACGYSTISFDYLYSLNLAPYSDYSSLGFLNYTTGGYVLSPGPGDDERPKWLIWSWPHDTSLSSTPQPAALVHENLNVVDNGIQLILSNYPATARWMTYRWQQMDPTTQLPFACAGPASGSASVFPDVNNWWGYQWQLTQGTGGWSKGETQCQKEFGPYFHFWRPMSASENFRLTLAMSNIGAAQVWLNHFPLTTYALPNNISLTYGSPTSQTSADIVITSGFGGAWTHTFNPSAGSPANFLTFSVNQSNILHVAVNQAVVNANPQNTFGGTVVITESHPDGSASTSSNVDIMLNSASNSFTASPATVDFKSGITQTVSLSSSPQNIEFSYDRTQTPSWLTVGIDKTTTPTALTLTLNPSAAPAVGFYSLTLTPTGSIVSYPALNINISFTTVKVTVGTNPANVPLTIDGAQAVPGTFTWVVGSTHQLVAPTDYTPAQPQTQYQFQDWTSGGLPLFPVASFPVTAPSQSAIYTAQFGVYYSLTIAQPPGGTVNASPPPGSNGMYLTGTNVTLTAAPAAGYVFKQFTGDLTSQQNPAPLTMNGPKSVSASFGQQQNPTTFFTNPPGLSIMVDGQAYPTPATFQWANPETHTICAPTANPAVCGPPQSPTEADIRYVFANWNDSTTTDPRTFSNFPGPANYTLYFIPQALLSVTISPALAGSVSGAGWYALNAPVTLQATPAQGFAFSLFSGGRTSTQNPLQFGLPGPLQVTANFTATKPPVLFASSADRVDMGNGVVQTPIVLNDLATAGPAGDATITSVTISGVPTGGGQPTITGFPANGIDVGTIFPGGTGQTVLNVNWPDSATRATFTVQYSANGGAYLGSNSITIYR